ncbi:MAG TPA: hypothetical protein PLD84_11335 [Chitinophagales bacterium]|nr:hypothetical protein [Chitinophagales bacterium]
MTHNFTPLDLIRFIYRETTPEEDFNIKQWITEDAAASHLFQKFAETSSSLDMEEMEPSESSVNIILDFSKENAHEESHA